MSDELKKSIVNETKVELFDGVGVNSWSMNLASIINDTNSFSNSVAFFALLPTYLRNYGMRYLRPACQWVDGYVPKLHGTGSNIVSSRIANRLITGFTKHVVGEKLIFKTKTKDKDSVKTLQFVSDWATKQNIIKAIYSGIGFALTCGTSLLKANKTEDGHIWWEASRMDNCWFTSSFKGEITEATFVITSYTKTTRNSGQAYYFLVERRYYDVRKKGEVQKLPDGTYQPIHEKGERTPKVEYSVCRIRGEMSQTTIGDIKREQSVKWEELPQEIRESIISDYSGIRVNEPTQLPFKDLGVQLLTNANIDLGVPRGYNFGESLVVPIQDDLITYDIASSYKLRDMYLGKGTVYVPKSLSAMDLTNPMLAAGNANPLAAGMGEQKIELMKGVDPETQKIIVQQFELRSGEWQNIMNDCVRNIATKWNMSPKILNSYLANSMQMTATQVDSEDDISISTIIHTRSYFLNAINKMLETTLNFYGKPVDVTIGFASPSLINKDRLQRRVIEKLNAGLCDIDTAIRELNPDLDEETLQERIEIAKVEREKIKEQQKQEMNFDGTFDDLDKLDIPTESEKILNGQTNNDKFVKPN